MRPDVLHVGRHPNRCARRERGVVDIHVPVGELFADALIEQRTSPSARAGGAGASDQRAGRRSREHDIEGATIHTV